MKASLNSNRLKLIAIIAMTIDHVTRMVFYASIYSTVYFFALDRIYGLIQLAVVLAIPLLATYNGERGRSTKINKFIKWVFYAYYPLHLLVIGLIRVFSK